MQEKFAVLKIDNGTYYPTHIVSNNDYLDTLMSVFTDGTSFAKDIKKELANPDSQGRTGNDLDLDFNYSKVTICYCFSDYCIEIDRQQLMYVIEKGVTLMEAKSNYIALHREDENSPIKVKDQAPHGMEFFIENKQVKARYKGNIYT